MKHPPISILAAIAILTAAAPAWSQSNAGLVEAQIRATEAQWNADFRARAVDALVAHYASDAVSMAPGAPTAVGTDAIRAATKDMIGDPNFALTFAPDKIGVAASGEMAYAAGRYAQDGTDPATHAIHHETGTYLTVYRKQADGTWKAVADINTPGPAAP
jgi:uncharacterized protein (TIGR02246 family)